MRRGWLTNLFMLGFCCGFLNLQPVALAQQSSSLKLDGVPASKKPLKLVAPKPRSFFERSLTSTQHSYLSSSTRYYREGAADTMTSFDYQVKSKSSRTGGVDTQFRYNAQEEAIYFRPMEIYRQFNVGEASQLYIGRKKMLWSRSDKLWRRGIVEPRHMDDALEAKRAGLLGVFYNQQGRRTRFMAFATPLFIPEFGPQFQVNGGRIESRNPWFLPTPNQIQLENGVTDLRFRVQNPDIVDTITKPGGGFGASHNFDSGFFAESSYLYKPMNQIALGLPFVVVLGDENEETTVDVDVHPRVTYHHFANLVMGQSFGSGSRVYAEVQYESPQDEGLDSSWIAKQNGEAVVYNLTFEQDLSSSTDVSRKVWASYSLLEGGDAQDSGDFATSESLFQRRYQFQNSVQLGWQGRVARLGNSVLSNMTKAIYDFAQEGYIFSTQSQMNFLNGWSALLQVEFLGLVNLDGEVRDGFIGDYRSNDRVSAGVSYVF